MPCFSNLTTNTPPYRGRFAPSSKSLLRSSSHCLLDEAFLDVTGSESLFGSSAEILLADQTADPR